MKNLLIILLIIPTLSFAQDPSPGDELNKFSTLFYTGLAINSIGIALTLDVALIAKPDDNDVYYLTGGITLAGWILMMYSFHHIGKAGVLMNERKLGITFNNGIGLRYRI